MLIYYSKSTGGFYNSDINGENIPDDATEESAWSLSYEQLMKGQSLGKLFPWIKRESSIIRTT